MATARTSQAHEKRVQKIAEDAAAKVAADSPLDEEVVVVVEELPPGASMRTQRSGREQAVTDGADAITEMVAQGQKFVAESINRWIGMTSGPFDMPLARGEPFSGLFDPRHLMEEGFRLVEELLASQKQFALRVVDALESARAA
jgi:hypothetical protein